VIWKTKREFVPIVQLERAPFRKKKRKGAKHTERAGRRKQKRIGVLPNDSKRSRVCHLFGMQGEVWQSLFQTVWRVCFGFFSTRKRIKMNRPHKEGVLFGSAGLFDVNEKFAFQMKKRRAKELSFSRREKHPERLLI